MPPSELYAPPGQLASVDGDLLLILRPDGMMPWQACRSKPHTKLDNDGDADGHCATLREIRCALWGGGSGVANQLAAEPSAECLSSGADREHDRAEPVMPTASAMFPHPRPQSRAVSQLELLITRLIDELSPLVKLLSTHTHSGSHAWIGAFAEFGTFLQARWATIQESLTRACKYIALGADQHAAEFAEIVAEDANLAAHLEEARNRISATWQCDRDLEASAWL